MTSQFVIKKIKKFKDTFEFMINCNAGEANLKNVDNLINVIKTNHKGTECNPKWAVCHALASLEPSKPPGAKILLDWKITEHWWWAATHFVFGK